MAEGCKKKMAIAYLNLPLYVNQMQRNVTPMLLPPLPMHKFTQQKSGKWKIILSHHQGPSSFYSLTANTHNIRPMNKNDGSYKQYSVTLIMSIFTLYRLLYEK